MAFQKDQNFFLTDSTDGKKYPVKVLSVDEEKEEMKVHYVGWKSSYDEVISFDSDRIDLNKDEAEEEEEEDSFCSTQEVGSTGAAIGRLLMAMDTESKKVISTFDIRLTLSNFF